MERIVVVGGTGFVGQAICRAAVQRGLEVIGVSRTSTPPANAHRHPWAAKVRWMRGDALDTATLEPALEYVYYLSARSEHDRCSASSFSDARAHSL